MRAKAFFSRVFLWNGFRKGSARPGVFLRISSIFVVLGRFVKNNQLLFYTNADRRTRLCVWKRQAAMCELNTSRLNVHNGFDCFTVSQSAGYVIAWKRIRTRAKKTDSSKHETGYLRTYVRISYFYLGVPNSLFIYLSYERLKLGAVFVCRIVFATKSATFPYPDVSHAPNPSWNTFLFKRNGVPRVSGFLYAA